MIERQEPKTPNADELWLEEQSENVTLVDREEMLKRLRGAMSPDAPEDVESKFFPLLLQYAGQTVLLSQVPSIIIAAMHGYVETEKGNLRYYIAGSVPSLVDAVVDDPTARQRIREFLAEALNG